jgi:hypothetical protein
MGTKAAGSVLRGLACAVLVGLEPSCASVSDDWHLAPLGSHVSRAGHGRESEFAAGAVRIRTADELGRVESWALRPLLSQERLDGGQYRTRFLVPLGSSDWIDGAETTQLLPVFRYHSEPTVRGSRVHEFLMLPGILWRRDDTDRIVRAVFPVGGVVEQFLTFDRIEFVLFPLYARTLRNGRTTYHVLFPVFSWSRKIGERMSWRVWPLYGASFTESSDRRFWLWPLIHVQRDGRDRPSAQRTLRWMVFPLLGLTRAGSFRAVSVLWPLFGWSRDRQSGFWAWDGPWPLVRLQRPGTSGAARRTRVWPLFSRYEGNGLESRWFLWPFLNLRRETTAATTREAEYLLPVWQHWRARDARGVESGRWRKLWPLFQEHSARAADGSVHSRSALVALNPLWHTPLIDDHYAWLYELLVTERAGAVLRQRSWGGLYKRERDEREDRAYFGPLWAQRSVFDEQGTGAPRARETSLLFGLVRWRRDERGTRWLRPAFPGPGFPPRRRSRRAHGASREH